jgi:hypothetical protein
MVAGTAGMLNFIKLYMDMFDRLDANEWYVGREEFILSYVAAAYPEALVYVDVDSWEPNLRWEGMSIYLSGIAHELEVMKPFPLIRPNRLELRWHGPAIRFLGDDTYIYFTILLGLTIAWLISRTYRTLYSSPKKGDIDS